MESRAAQSALGYIRDEMTVGLGSGKAIEYLIEFISMSGLENIKITTPYIQTAMLAARRDLTVVPMELQEKIDVAFDQLDYTLQSVEGSKVSEIVTEDKLLMTMADHAYFFTDRRNYHTTEITGGLPVVIEVARPALSFVTAKINQMSSHGAAAQSLKVRMSGTGNYLIEAALDTTVPVSKLEADIKALPGVIETSLFTGLKATILIYDDEQVETVEV